MVKADVAAYTPPPDFQEETKDSLVDIEFNDSTEFWLIELPENRSLDFDGKEISLDFRQDGQLGSLEESSAGKISRHVSLVHYPEPDELIAVNTDQKQMRKSTTMTAMTPTKSMRTPYSQTKSRSNHTSRKSSVSDVGDERKAQKRTLAEPSASKYSDLSARSGLTNSGLSDQSCGKKSNWKADNEA